MATHSNWRTALLAGLSHVADKLAGITPASIGAQPAATGTPDGSKFLRDDGSWAEVPSGGGGGGYVPGAWCIPLGGYASVMLSPIAGQRDVRVLGGDRYALQPFEVPRSFNFASLSVDVKTAGAAGGRVRAAIYPDGGGVPTGLPLYDTAALAIDTTGVKTAMVAGGLSPGMYWVVTWCTSNDARFVGCNGFRWFGFGNSFGLWLRNVTAVGMGAPAPDLTGLAGGYVAPNNDGVFGGWAYVQADGVS